MVFDDVGIPLSAGRRKAFNRLNEMIYCGEIKVEPVERCFCENSDFETLSRYDRFGLPFGTKICKSCGLITQTIRIHPDSLAKFYEDIYWPLIIGIEDYSTAPKKDETSPYILKHIPEGWSDITIFEVGCGSGGRISMLARELENSGRKVTAVGCDYSPDALEAAARRGIQTVQGGMEQLQSAGKADILILSHVFEHFPSLDIAMSQIKSLLHDRSIVYVEVPGVADLENKREYLFNYQMYCVLAHTYNFSLSSLRSVMAKYGLGLLEGDEYVRAVFAPGSENLESISAYGEIMAALGRAGIKQKELEWRRNNKLVRYMRNVAKSLLGREV